MLPGLTTEQVNRFVAFGENGWDRLGAGDYEGAERSFRGQLDIFAGNAEPFVSLAMLHAATGDRDEACAFFREAVLRGFTDMRRLDRAEAWSRMTGDPRVERLREALPALAEIEESWAEWSAFRSRLTPPDVASVVAKHDEASRHVERTRPALGDRLARLWERMLDRTTASLLLAYVQERRDAEDADEAARRLFELYAGGPLSRWTRAETDSANRMAEVAKIVLERDPDPGTRPAALVARALVWNLDRDRKSRLRPGALGAIRKDLGEVLDKHSDHPVAATAAVGLVRVEYEDGDRAAAAERYRGIVSGVGRDADVLERVRDGLGEVALLVGGVPEFSGKTLAGATVDRASLGGKVFIVDFWATWCGPCVEQIETLRQLDERHGDDVAVLGINLDDAEAMSGDELSAWIAGHGVPGEHVFDGRAWESEVAKAFGVREIPFTVVVGQGGEVVAVNDHGRDLERVVRRAVKRP